MRPSLRALVLVCAVLPAAAQAGADERGTGRRATIQDLLDRRVNAAAESLAAVAIEESVADSGQGRYALGVLLRQRATARTRMLGRTDRDSAVAQLERGLAALRHDGGRGTADEGLFLMDLGLARGLAGDLTRARADVREGLALAEARLGARDTLLLRGIATLANLSARTGDRASARALWPRAFELEFRRARPDTIAAYEHWVDVALAAQNDFDYAAAESAMAICEPVFEARPAQALDERIRLLSVRESVARRQGDLPARLRSLDRWLALERTRGERTRRIVTIEHLRAETLSLLGDGVGAVAAFESALAACEASVRSDDPRCIPLHAELAQHLDAIGRSEDAERAFGRASAEAARLEPQGGPQTAFVLAARAGRVYKARRWVEARGLFERAIAMIRDLPSEDDDRAVYLLELARVTADLRLPDTTTQLVAQSRALSARRYPPTHPRFADLEAQEAWAHGLAGDGRHAWDLALRSTESHLRELTEIARGASELDALSRGGERQYRLAMVLTLAARHADSRRADDRARADASWDLMVRSRGLVLEEIARRVHRRAERGDSTRMRLERDWRIASARLADLLVTSPTAQDTAGLRRLDEARRAARVAERSWALAAGMSPGVAEDAVLADRLRGALGPRRALVSYAHAGGVFLDTRGVYLAAVLRGDGGGPRMVPLGDAVTIDSLVTRWRETLDLTRARDPQALARLEREAAAVGAALRQRVWDPVQDALRDLDEVVLVPDGDLHLVPFAALPDGRGGFLVSRPFTLAVLSRELDLLEPATTAPVPGGLLALGAPDFEQRGAGESVAAASFRGATGSCARFRDLRFAALPGTAEEVRAIAALAGGSSAVRTGAAADEASFKREAPRHRALHLATHGFYLDDACTAPAAGMRGIGGLAPADTAAAGARPAAPAEPLRLAGLALAGANRRAEAAPGEEDGVLTAEEIAALDLRGVERVVLSACRSGVGQVLTGEGVTGLRRAFRVAGVRTLVMSLWEVDDRATAEWMRTLYSAWSPGTGAARAVHEASRRQLAARRAAGASTHPAYWGAFVAVSAGR